MEEDGSCSNLVDIWEMTIDVAKLGGVGDKEGRTQELGKLASVAKEWGMFIITNHGIPNSVFADIEEAVKGFFALPTVKAKKASFGSYMSQDNKEDGRNFLKSEHLPPLWVDRLTVKAAPKEQAPPDQSLWPLTPPNFSQVMENYVDEARKLCDELLKDLAEALSLDRNVFLKNFEPSPESEVKVKANYYPPCPNPDQVMGLPAHSDGSALAVLMQFGATAGLQVLKDMKWFTISWPSDTLLINFGDLMEIMSNGRLKSSWHRVVPPFNADRTSVALFYNPPSHVEIEPIPVPSEEGYNYKKVLVGEYLHHLYSTRSFATTATKQGLNFAKVY